MLVLFGIRVRPGWSKKMDYFTNALIGSGKEPEFSYQEFCFAQDLAPQKAWRAP